MTLDAKKIPYEKVDIAADEEAKKKMRDLIGDPKALPPQLFNDDTYCGVSYGREYPSHNGNICIIYSGTSDKRPSEIGITSQQRTQFWSPFP